MVPLEDAVFGDDSFERSAVVVVEREVEKCLEEGRRER